ncbi:MAG TPA: DUF1049 domain-containing protein [Phycisphaerales bacterium]|nr:DUF1049 domain-containing protein [Phycisphaerales bacterium]
MTLSPCRQEGMHEMKKAKVILMIVLSLTTLVIFLQNTRTVEVRILLLSIPMPLILLLMAVSIMSFVVGLVMAGQMLKKPKSAQKARTDK